MIKYDSHNYRELCSIPGSVFPKALRNALAVAAWVFAFKWMDLRGLLPISFESTEPIKNNAVYSGFTFTLGFMMVFRVSQSYSRFLESARAAYRMREQWCESAAGLVNFAEISDFDGEDILMFQHQVIRLFSLLHASAIGVIAEGVPDATFPIIDMQSFEKTDLLSMQRQPPTQRVHLAYQWIQVLVVKCIKSGFLNVPAPILTRVFQEMEQGMLQFTELVQIMQVPFPFPYAQCTFVLIQLHAVITPFVMSVWTTNPWCAALFTFISHLCLVAVDHIATELENPFGQDVNDLPVSDFHKDFNDTLTLLLLPAAMKVPNIAADASMDYRQVISKGRSGVFDKHLLGVSKDVDDDDEDSAHGVFPLDFKDETGPPLQSKANMTCNPEASKGRRVVKDPPWKEKPAAKQLMESICSSMWARSSKSQTNLSVIMGDQDSRAGEDKIESSSRRSAGKDIAELAACGSAKFLERQEPTHQALLASLISMLDKLEEVTVQDRRKRHSEMSNLLVNTVSKLGQRFSAAQVSQLVEEDVPVLPGRRRRHNDDSDARAVGCSSPRIPLTGMRPASSAGGIMPELDP